MVTKRFALAATLLALIALVAFGIRQYQWNVSGLLHMDVAFGERHQVPSGVVLYEDAAYDGMLYYQVARDIPALFSGGQPSYDSPYRFQRILLPLLTYGVAFGQQAWFPMAMLIINLAAGMLALWLVIAMTGKPSIHALSVVFNPAILVGILYALTEPLSLLFVIVFLWLYERNNRRIDLLCLGALLVSLLARETTVFLIGLLFLWELWHRRWKSAFLLIIPVALFTFWQYFLMLRFGVVGFNANSNVVDVPLGGPITLLLWLTQGVTTYRLSGLAYLLFAAALCAALGREVWVKRMNIDMHAFLLAGLAIAVLSMDAHMWGAITSIGRVVTPIYPVYAIYAAKRDTWIERTVSVMLIVVSVVAAIGITYISHPYVIS